LFERLIPLKKYWFTQCSIDVARDTELLRLAARSGCRAVFVGVETFDSDNLRQIRKRQNHVARYREAMDAFHAHGIAVAGGIIIGLDHDTADGIGRIPDLAEEIGLDVPMLNLLTPLPGTVLRDEMRKDGRLLAAPWSRHNSSSAAYVPGKLSPSEMESVYVRTWRDVYAKGRSLRRVIRCAPRLRPVANILNVYANWAFTMVDTSGQPRRLNTLPLMD
jgi:radical SAM superfamily enzyme YgiQ (UPF0313 family)